MSLILTDIDHVVLSHADSFKDWLIKYKNKSFEKCGDWRDHNNFEEWLDIDHEKGMMLVNSFNRSKYFADLKPICKSETVIPRLHSEGFKFIAITACGNSEEIYNGRKENLQKYFPDIFEDLICVNRCSDKKYYLEQYDQAIWVEDSYNNAVLGRDCNHQTFLMDYYFNRDKGCMKNITRVSDWEEIEKHIKCDY